MEKMQTELSKAARLFASLEADAPDDAAVYRCPLCRDSGYIFRGDRAYPCSCMTKNEIRGKKQAAGLSPRLLRMRFDNFRLDLYSDSKKDGGRTHRELAELALRDAKKFADRSEADTAPGSLLLEGDVGSGKTHLAAAIANELLENGADVLFLVVPEFLEQLRACYRQDHEGEDESELIRRAYDAEVLILDDLGAHNFTEWVQNKLFTIINHRYNRELPCVITTNLNLAELDEQIGYRTTSRISESCVLRRLVADEDLRLGKGVRV